MVDEIALELAFTGCEEIHLLPLSAIDRKIHAFHSLQKSISFEEDVLENKTITWSCNGSTKHKRTNL